MLAQLTSAVLEWVTANPGWVGLCIFLVAAWESMIVVGVMVPGAILMFSFGALIGLGYVDFWGACLWAALGAVFGDAFSYWAGWRFQGRLRSIWPLSRYPAMLDQGTLFFHRHGGKSVVFARFFGPLRGAVPAVAGMVEMPLGRFMLINILSALLWAPITLMFGMVFAASLELAAQVAWRLMVLLGLFALLLYLSWWLVQRTLVFLQPRAGRWLVALVGWSRGHPLLERVVGPLLDPGAREWQSIVTIALLILSAAVLAQLVGIASNETLPTAVDRGVFLFLQDLRTPQADRLLLRLSDLGGLQVLIPLTATVGLYLLARHQLLALGHWLLAVTAGLVFFNAFKVLFQVPRPAEQLLTFSFPSGHATMSVVVYGFLAVLVARDTVPQWRWVPYGVATVLAVGIGFSRLYLGVHWLADVLAGWSLGLFWVVLIGVAYRSRPASSIGRTALLGVSLPTLVLVAAVMAGDPQARLERHRPLPVLATLSEASWWETDWEGLRLLDRENDHDQLLDLQFAGDLRSLAERLLAQGWQWAEPMQVTDLLYFLSPEVNVNTLPVLPQVRQGRDETLRLMRSDGAQHRWVLRFWDAGVRLEDSRPLWVGSVERQQLQRRLDFFTLTQPTTADRLPPGLPGEALNGLRCQRVVTEDAPLLLISDQSPSPGLDRKQHAC